MDYGCILLHQSLLGIQQISSALLICSGKFDSLLITSSNNGSYLLVKEAIFGGQMAWKCYKHSLYVRYNKSSQKAKWLRCSQNRATLGTVLFIRYHPPLHSSFHHLSQLSWMRKVIRFGDEIVAIEVVILKCPQGPVNAEAFRTFRLDSLNKSSWDRRASLVTMAMYPA